MELSQAPIFLCFHCRMMTKTLNYSICSCSNSTNCLLFLSLLLDQNFCSHLSTSRTLWPHQFIRNRFRMAVSDMFVDNARRQWHSKLTEVSSHIRHPVRVLAPHFPKFSSFPRHSLWWWHIFPGVIWTWKLRPPPEFAENTLKYIFMARRWNYGKF